MLGFLVRSQRLSVLLYLTACCALAYLFGPVSRLQNHLIHILVLRVVNMPFGRLLRAHISGRHWFKRVHAYSLLLARGRCLNHRSLGLTVPFTVNCVVEAYGLALTQFKPLLLRLRVARKCVAGNLHVWVSHRSLEDLLWLFGSF